MGELIWRGDEVLAQASAALGAAMTEIGLRVEAAAKRRLKKSLQLQKAARTTYQRGPKKGKPKRAYAQWVKGGGRGVRTGTLRRSIHAATPGYNWAADDTPPTNNSPERGGQPAEAKRTGDRLVVQVGTGMRYGLAVHDRHYNPAVNGFLKKSAEAVKAEVPAIVERRRLKGDSDGDGG